MTTAEEVDLLARAEMNRRQKAAQHPPEPSATKSDFETTLARVAKLPSLPQDEASARLVGAKVAELRDLAKMPKRHNKPIARAETEWQTKFDSLTAMIGKGFLIALAGTQGTGKTMMGCAVIRAATAQNKSCLFTTAMDFFIALKSTSDEQAKMNEAAAISIFTKPALLVIDEMDERSESQWENRMIFHAINKRYQDEKDTLLISRKHSTEFLDSMGASGESIKSRLKETGAIIDCEWPSFR